MDVSPDMNDWPEYDFIIPERESRTTPHGELTGWETVIFEVADEEAPPADE